LHGLFPGTTADLFALCNRLLPSYGGQGQVSARGMEIEPRVNSQAFERATVLGRKAARQYHEFPGTRNVLTGGGPDRPQ
jgi:hypothetical protein